MAPKVKKKVKKLNKVAKAPASKSSGVQLKLREVLDISYAEKLKKEAIELFEKSAQKGMLVDASGVNRITTPCIQIIISLAKSCELAKISFKLASPSEAFKKAFYDVGLSKELTSWSN